MDPYELFVDYMNTNYMFSWSSASEESQRSMLEACVALNKPEILAKVLEMSGLSPSVIFNVWKQLIEDSAFSMAEVLQNRLGIYESKKCHEFPELARKILLEAPIENVESFLATHRSVNELVASVGKDLKTQKKDKQRVKTLLSYLETKGYDSFDLHPAKKTFWRKLQDQMKKHRYQYVKDRPTYMRNY